MSAPLSNNPGLFDLETPARLRAAPPLEPPYDDESAAIGAPALRVVPGLDTGLTAEFVSGLVPGHVSGLGAADELPFERGRAGLRIAGWHLTDEDDDPFFAPQPTPRVELSDPALHGRRILRAVFEVLGRRRPLQQLLPWTTEDVYEELTAWVYRRMRADSQPQSAPAMVRSVRAGEPADGVAELTAVVHLDGRVRAVVLRLEGADGRWRCTLLRLV